VTAFGRSLRASKPYLGRRTRKSSGLGPAAGREILGWESGGTSFGLRGFGCLVSQIALPGPGRGLTRFGEVRASHQWRAAVSPLAW
jgi:hypothetical protein